MWGLWFCVNRFLSCLCHYYSCCYSLFPYLTAVSCKLFLSQPVTFIFVPPIFPSSPLQCGRVRGKAGEQESVSGLESGGIELGRTVPKPQQYNSFQYCKILIAVNYLHDKLCSEQGQKIILNSWC